MTTQNSKRPLHKCGKIVNTIDARKRIILKRCHHKIRPKEYGLFIPVTIPTFAFFDENKNNSKKMLSKKHFYCH